MIGLLLYLVILALIFGVIWWGITQLPIPAPFGMVIRVIFVVIVVIVLVSVLARVGGIDIGLNGPPLLRLN